MRYATTCLAAAMFVASAAGAQETAKPSVKEARQLAFEIGKDEAQKYLKLFREVGVSSQQPDASLSAPAQQALISIGNERKKLVQTQLEVAVESTDLRLQMDVTGVLAGTLLDNPAAGLRIADTVADYTIDKIYGPLLKAANDSYQQDLTRAIGRGILKNAPKFAPNATDAEKRAEIEKVLRQQMEFVSPAFLDGLTPQDRDAAFKAAVPRLLNALRDNTDRKLALTDAEVDKVKSNVAAVQRFAAQQKKFNDLVRTDLVSIRRQLDAQQSDMRFLQEKVLWDGLDASKKAEALQRGWFSGLSEEDRATAIERYETIAKADKIAGDLGKAGQAVQFLASLPFVSDEHKAELSNLQKNISGVSTVVSAAGLLASQQYFGAAMALGGLLGGGGDSNAQVMSALREINARLDIIIEYQKVILAEVRALRELTTKNFASMQHSLAQIKDKLKEIEAITESIKFDGLDDDCTRLYNIFHGNQASDYGMEQGSFRFTSYDKRKEFFYARVEDLKRCRGGIEYALNLARAGGSPGSPYLPSSWVWFQSRFYTKQINSLPGNHKDLEKPNTSLYEAMLAYTQLLLGPDVNDQALFAALTLTPRRLLPGAALTALKGEKPSMSYKLAFRPGLVASFKALTDVPLDVERLTTLKRFIDMYLSFAIYLDTDSNKMIPIPTAEALATRPAVHLADIRMYHRHLRDLVNIAIVQEAAMSGALIADIAAEVLVANGFGGDIYDCKSAQGLEEFKKQTEIDRLCGWKKNWHWNKDNVAQLRLQWKAETNPTKKQKNLEQIDNLILETPEWSSAKPGKVEEDTPKQHLARLRDLSGADCNLQSGDPQQLKYSITVCLLVKNPIFAYNVALALVRKLGAVSVRADGTVSSASFELSTTLPKDRLLRQLFRGHSVTFSRGKGGEWSFVFRDLFGEALDLPMPTDVAGLRAAETPTMRELKALLAEIDNDLIELSWCTAGNEQSCPATVREVVIEAAAAPGFVAQAIKVSRP